MGPYDVYFFEAFREELPELRDRLPSHVRAGFTEATIQESGIGSPPARLLSIRTQSVIPPDWLPSLDGLLARSTGFDHLLALPHGSTRLGALPEYCSRAVAEHAILLVMALLRRLPRQIRQFRTFHRDDLTGRESAGRPIAIFGVGRIGYDTAQIARSLGMHVLGVDIVHRHADIQYVQPEEALHLADAIVCTMNLTPGNRGYFTADLLQAARRKPVFVNVSRGELAPTPVLEQALATGILSGVGLDVFDDEQALASALRGHAAASSPDLLAIERLAARPDVLLTPHNAFNTMEAVARKSEFSIRQILHFLDRGEFLWTLDDLRKRD